MIFSDTFLIALGNWQRGWREDQRDRLVLADALKQATEDLPEQFRMVTKPCFRKRFLMKGELLDIVVRDEFAEGVTSWTLDQRFAERFKGMIRPDAVSAAIFQHTPSPDEVLLDVSTLWQHPNFIDAVKKFVDSEHPSALPLLNFRDTQAEVILTAPLKGSEIIALAGVSSSFDELCDRASIPEDMRDALFKELIDDGTYPGEPRYTSPLGAQNVLVRTIKTLKIKIDAAKAQTI